MDAAVNRNSGSSSPNVARPPARRLSQPRVVPSATWKFTIMFLLAVQPAATARFLLARHGQTNFNAEGRMQGTLDTSVLTAAVEAAFKLAGRPVDEVHLRKSMKLLDKNGDGLVDLDEFKAIALNMAQLGAS